jgi:GTP pyrophosphokinase
MLEERKFRGGTLVVEWARKDDGFEFFAALRVSGDDRPGMLNDITHAIVSYRNTNIRSVNIESKDSLFEGIVTVLVRHTDHLERLIERLRKIPNVDHVERFDQGNFDHELQ